MREIKFRAWHRETKISKPFTLNDLSATQKQTNYPIEQYKIMQYTGLKDNTKWESLKRSEQQAFFEAQKDCSSMEQAKEKWNGKEIYEGDIMKTFEGNIKQVLYKGCCFFLSNKIGVDSTYLTLHVTYGEIIGNIYENSNLLKGGK